MCIFEVKLMVVDKNFCMSSFLMLRYIYDTEKSFMSSQKPLVEDITFPRAEVTNSDELLHELKTKVELACQDGKAALALSGGIDSSLLAYFMPEGSTAYTFRCVIPGKKVQDETEKASKIAKMCHLNHKIVDITWEDVVRVTETLLKRKGAPFHSIETQIYIAACQVKKDGFSKFIFGEHADIIYGGLDGLLSKDWLVGEFVDRYSYILPYKAIKSPIIPMEPFLKHSAGGGVVDPHAFINEYLRQEALGSYTNACEAAGIKFVGPYAETNFTPPLDYDRVRNGDSKYVIREAFHKLYPEVNKLPPKTPMPRPMNEWMNEHYDGPQREEFIPHCTDNMTGDQKWLVYCLERFLNLNNL